MCGRRNGTYKFITAVLFDEVRNYSHSNLITSLSRFRVAGPVTGTSPGALNCPGLFSLSPQLITTVYFIFDPRYSNILSL